jgi:hypothetical protein
MPLIPFPNIPAYPGVPQLTLPPIGTLLPAPPVNVSSFDPSSLSDQPTIPDANKPIWSIVDSTGAEVIEPDSIIDFDYRNERKIPNYPVEQGSFSSYNKVALPFDIRLTLACGGSGEMTRNAFIGTIENMLNSLDLYSIVTPDYVYENANLVHVNYRRDSKQGVTLLKAELWFEEVRQSNTGNQPTQEPSGSDIVYNGQLSPTTPSTTQASSINSNIIL